MSQNVRLTMRRSVVVAGAVLMLLLGAGVTYLLLVPGPSAPGSASSSPTPAPKTATGPADLGAADSSDAAAAQGHVPGAQIAEDVVVSIPQDAVDRAGITVQPVGTSASGGVLTLPGVIEPNAYRQVAVTPLVGGRVTRVSVVLGDRVERGQRLANVYSPELAEAHTRYVSAMSRLRAHDFELTRTRKLAQIGAASTQEFERVHAEHTAQRAEAESARSRLALLGVRPHLADTAGEVGADAATSVVRAPIGGIVTQREADVGLNVEPSTPLFTIVDLSTVWVVASVYEKDFAAVRVGARATVTTAAYPALALQGRVSYVDPQVDAGTRTARVRVEVPNSGAQLRLGMYAQVAIAHAASGETPVVPRVAVQALGRRSVVYVVDPRVSGRFIEREVRVGRANGDAVEVLSGVSPGEVVVTEGSFFVRAERERTGGAAHTHGQAADRRPALGDTSQSGEAAPRAQRATVQVSARGFEPSTITLHAGVPARLTFTRTSDETCAKAVVFPSLNIRRDLPLRAGVEIAFTPTAGTIAFACGMDMFKGTVVVE